MGGLSTITTYGASLLRRPSDFSFGNRNHTFAIGDPLNQLINTKYHQREWDHNPPQHKEHKDCPPKNCLVNG